MKRAIKAKEVDKSADASTIVPKTSKRKDKVVDDKTKAEKEKAKKEKARVAKFRATMARTRRERYEDAQEFSKMVERNLAASEHQNPLTDDDRKRLSIELDLNKQDIEFIEELLQSRRNLNHKLYDLRNPEDCYLPLQGRISTYEEDLIAIDATTYGCAEPVEGDEDLIAVDMEKLERFRRGEQNEVAQ